MANNLDKFTDIEFPPTDMAIYDPDEQFPFKSGVVWRRAKDFLTDENGKPPKVFSGAIEPSDIKQGQLGDCWFMSALSSIAEFPDLVKKLFITKNYQKDGVYRVQFCKDGIW